MIFNINHRNTFIQLASLDVRCYGYGFCGKSVPGTTVILPFKVSLVTVV
jgi:hypothetical protein